ncbi:hypothetical protein [Piscirickettsia litoralis]|uniref:hypothetical protein n=1 Tax=Piscirickettsia litoralis TaxID=1891921 RepID=UPI0009811D18|nr:hypothetical protein [Piscirickettsia litoralis]
MNQPIDLDKANLIIKEVVEINNDSDDDIEPEDFVPKNDIFLNIPLERRIESMYYDFEVSSLEDCLIDYKKIKVAVEKLAVLSDFPKKEVRGVANEIAEKNIGDYTL